MAATRATKTTTAAKPPRATPTRRMMPTPAAATPAPGIDWAALAGGAVVAKALPSTSTGGSTSPLRPLLDRSLAEGVALTLPPVSEREALTIRNAVRRIASTMTSNGNKVGIAIRTTTTEAGHAVSFQVRERKGVTAGT